LDNPFVVATQPNIFPTPTASPPDRLVFTDVRAYLSLKKYDMKSPMSTCGTSRSNAVSTSWVVSAGYVGSHTSNILESTPAQ